MRNKKSKKKNYKIFEYRLYNQKNLKLLWRHLDIPHEVHVHFIKLCRRYRQLYGIFPHRYQLSKHLTKLKHRTKPHWYGISNPALQDIIFRIDGGNQKFITRGNNKKIRPPKIKPRSKYRSITLTIAGGFKIEGNRIKINKLDKWFTFWKSRDFDGKIKQITIKKDSVGHWYLYVTVEQESIQNEVASMTGQAAGIDFNLKDYLVLSNGIKIQNPEFFKQKEDIIREKNKIVSRKEEDSKNYHKARKDLAKAYVKIANQRDDWIKKMARRLAKDYDIIFTEDLNLKGMKKLWGKKVSDLSYSKFLLWLEWMCKKFGRHFEKRSRWTPTTKPCNKCGFINKELTLADRAWKCPSCGKDHDRDINAALNILFGTRKLEVQNCPG